MDALTELSGYYEATRKADAALDDIFSAMRVLDEMEIGVTLGHTSNSGLSHADGADFVREMGKCRQSARKNLSALMSDMDTIRIELREMMDRVSAGRTR